MSLDDLLEVMNQAAIWIAKKDYRNDFWKAESFLKVTLPKWKKWQKAWQWKNRITHYTPRVKPATHSDAAIEGVIEEWDPKKPKGTSQIKTIMVSPMFGPEITAPLAEWLKAKAVSSHILTWTAWVQFPPSPTHDTCLLCSAMSGLMKLACLNIVKCFE